MKKRQRQMVRIIAIVLAVLLGCSALVSAVFSIAYGEEAQPMRNQQTLSIEYLENEQALRISQRLVYTNVSNVHLDRVVFYAPANLLRRQAAMAYAADDLAAAFPRGYVPGGIELSSVLVDGQAADWGFQGDTESYLRVSCDLDLGEKCEFAFEYYLLLSENSAFLGIDSEDCRLSNFYFAPASVDESCGECILNAPLPFTEYIETPAADFSAVITLPNSALLSSAGVKAVSDNGDGSRKWTVEATNIFDFTLIFGIFKENSVETSSGTLLRCLSKNSSDGKRVLTLAEAVLSDCEAWFGSLPFAQIDLVQSSDCRSFSAHSGVIWLNEALFKRKNADQLAHALRFSIAKQYFGFSARARVSSDAWLSDSLCEYLSYLLLEESEGYDAYIQALNEKIVPSLQLTIPGGLVVTSDAALFTGYEYEIVILDRGAAVFHELRTAMGREKLLDGLRTFYEMSLSKEILTEMDLVSALDRSSGGKWEKFLTDWVFNIGDYVNQNIDWLD